MTEERTPPRVAPRVEPAPVPVAPEVSAGRSMRARLARMGSRGQASNPVLEPLFRAVRANHPKADLALLERAYVIAERLHADQKRKSGDPYITHPAGGGHHPRRASA